MISGKKILLVEDSPTIRLQINMMLKDEGIILVETGSEWGMNTKIEEYGVVADLIIMDLILNYENGLELIKKLKSTPKYKDIPIIIITQKIDVSSVLEAKNLGVKSYLKKPIKKATLISRINEAFSKDESL